MTLKELVASDPIRLEVYMAVALAHARSANGAAAWCEAQGLRFLTQCPACGLLHFAHVASCGLSRVLEVVMESIRAGTTFVWKDIAGGELLELMAAPRPALSLVERRQQ